MLFGEGFRAFVTDWDKVTATVRLCHVLTVLHTLTQTFLEANSLL